MKKTYHPPATPHQGLLADARTSDDVRHRLTAIHATLDPIALLRSIRGVQQELVEIADRPVTAEAAPPTAPTIAQFLVRLHTAWKDGEVHPTNKAKE